MKTAGRFAENAGLNNVMGSFISSYAGRDKNVDFSDWLAGRLQEEMPDMPSETSERLSEDIINAVAEYDKTLDELNEAVEAGQSKEEWLTDRAIEACADMSYDDAGGRLQQVYSDLNAANAGLMRELEDVPGEEEIVHEAEIVEWNEYSLKDKAQNIGRQAVMSGLSAAVSAVRKNMESGEITDTGDMIGQALQEGIETAAGEVKAVVAGAIKTAAEKGLTDMLPAGTPVETVCDIAGVAVESAGALFDAARGKSTMVEALEKAGRASVAAACRFCAGALKVKLTCIPVVGPLVAEFAGGLLNHMKSPKFSENVYTVVRDTARATWEGIKQTGRNIWNRLKNSVTERLFN